MSASSELPIRAPHAVRRPAAARLAAAMALTATLGALAPAGARADDDEWLAPDKALHFSVSAALASGGYALGALDWHERSVRAAAGATFALTLGAAKELLDLAGLGEPSWRDLTWDVVGAAVGVALALGVDLLIEALGHHDGRSPARAAR